MSTGAVSGWARATRSSPIVLKNPRDIRDDPGVPTRRIPACDSPAECGLDGGNLVVQAGTPTGSRGIVATGGAGISVAGTVSECEVGVLLDSTTSSLEGARRLRNGVDAWPQICGGVEVPTGLSTASSTIRLATVELPAVPLTPVPDRAILRTGESQPCCSSFSAASARLPPGVTPPTPPTREDADDELIGGECRFFLYKGDDAERLAEDRLDVVDLAEGFVDGAAYVDRNSHEFFFAIIEIDTRFAYAMTVAVTDAAGHAADPMFAMIDPL